MRFLLCRLNALCYNMQVRAELDKIKGDVIKICGYFPTEFEEKNSHLGSATSHNENISTSEATESNSLKDKKNISKHNEY